MSTVFLRHATHRLAELGTMGVPQSAHNTLRTAGPGTNSMMYSGDYWSLSLSLLDVGDGKDVAK